LSMKICRECGKEFEPADYRQTICSDVCRKIRNRRKQYDWIAANPEKIKMKSKADSLIHSQKCIIICSICGAPVDSYINWDGRICRRRLHESCIMKDIAETALKGDKLSELQKSRLRNLGTTKEEVLKEYRNEI